MSSLPRPMVSVGTATSLPPLPGPAPSPTSRRRRGCLQLTRAPRTLAAASWRRRRGAAAGVPLGLFHLRPPAPLGAILSPVHSPLHWMARRSDAAYMYVYIYIYIHVQGPRRAWKSFLKGNKSLIREIPYTGKFFINLGKSLIKGGPLQRDPFTREIPLQGKSLQK